MLVVFANYFFIVILDHFAWNAGAHNTATSAVGCGSLWGF